MTRPRPIFISGRVRSGSTMLWNIYNQAPGYRAFYQPCHDNLFPHIRYTAPMESHRGVSDYWGAYRDLGEGLEEAHRSEFGIARLLLESTDEHVALRDYIQFLIDQCDDDETPVLQFNAMCWRLPWLRAQFPDAHVVHLWRNPRDSWFSMIRHLPRELWDEPDLADAYDLLQWSVDLAPHFPFLFGEDVQTSYARTYLLWALSRLAGEHCSDTVICFDDIQGDPRSTLDRMVDSELLCKKAAKVAKKVIEPMPRGAWRAVHDDDWFTAIEERGDALLDSLGLMEHFGLRELSSIRASHASA